MSETFKDLLGEVIIKNDGQRVDTSVLEQNELIGLYFGAEWCPPSLEFTQKLTALYNELKKFNKKFEVVYIGRDKSESEFVKHFSTMPWLALPYEQRDLEDRLCTKFQADGLPTLLLLNKHAHIHQRDGVLTTLLDPKGTKFPWPRKGLWDILDDTATLLDNNQQKHSTSELRDKSAVGIYFGAAKCSAFTDTLVTMYNKLKEQSKSFEVVFVSHDVDEQGFASSLSSMPWLALPYTDRERKLDLDHKYHIEAVPSLVIVDPSTGVVINHEAVERIENDPMVVQFPWKPKLVEPLHNGVTEKLSTAPAVILFVDTVLDTTIQALHKAAQQFGPKLGVKGDDEEIDETPRSSLYFFYSVKGHRLGDAMRCLANVEEVGKPHLVMMNLADGTKSVCQETVLNETTITKFVEAVLDKTVPIVPLTAI